MTVVLDIAAEDLRRAGLRAAGLMVLKALLIVVAIDRSERRCAVVVRRDERPRLRLKQEGRSVAEYAVTEWTPRHTSAVQAWIEEAIVDEDLGGEVKP